MVCELIAGVRKKKDLVRIVGGHLSGLPYSEKFDDQLLRDVLHHHPWRDEKLEGHLVTHFRKRKNLGSYVIIAVRDDGGEVDFSYRKCIDGYFNKITGKPALTSDYHYNRDVEKAMRHAVQEQIDQWGVAHAATRRPDDVIDHVHPLTFSYLSDLFLRMVQSRETYGDDWAIHLPRVLPARPGVIDGGADAWFFAVLANAEIADAWKNFHAENAVLRWLPSEVNSSIGNRHAGDERFGKGTPLRNVVAVRRGWWSAC
jgi:hypothetical protein